MVGRWKDECDGQDVQGQEKNEVIIKNSLRLLLEFMRVFELLEFITIWM
jgi:hypothetical protein